MGTNYYLFTKSKKVIQEFGEYGFELTDTPDFGYEVHIGKTSCGWKPLLQAAPCYKTFAEFEKFFKKHRGLKIYDEYEVEHSFEEFKELLIAHPQRKKEPLKWVYKENEFDPARRKILMTVDCSEEEAELYVPIDHITYAETRKKARKKYHYYELADWEDSIKQWRDPDYEFDWSEGDFR